jgi:hypothetical protein
VGRQEEFTKEQEKNALEAVKLAVELGIDPNAANRDGRTALLGATLLGANSIIQLLAEKGANLEAKDRYGQTALSIASGVPRDGGADKRFRGGRARKSTADLLLKLGATPLPPEAAKRYQAD